MKDVTKICAVNDLMMASIEAEWALESRDHFIDTFVRAAGMVSTHELAKQLWATIAMINADGAPTKAQQEVMHGAVARTKRAFAKIDDGSVRNELEALMSTGERPVEDDDAA